MSPSLKIFLLLVLVVTPALLLNYMWGRPVQRDPNELFGVVEFSPASPLSVSQTQASSRSGEVIEALALDISSNELKVAESEIAAGYASGRELFGYPLPSWISRSIDAFQTGSQKVFGSVLRLRRVDIHGLSRLSREQVLRIAGIDEPPWIWSLSETELRSRLEESPWIETGEVSVSFLLPKLSIRVVEEKPWLVAEIGKHSWLISESGYPIEPLESLKNPDLIIESSELPRIVGLEFDELTNVDALRPPSALNVSFASATRTIRFIDLAGGLPFPVARYVVLPGGAGLRITAVDERSSPQILVNATGVEEAREKLGQLRAILRDLKLRKERPEVIDLRFTNQATVR